jgi:hypothetical protein
VLRLCGFALIGLFVIAALLIVRTSIEARAVAEVAPPITVANAAEPDVVPLAKADKLPPPDFVVRMPVVPVEPAPSTVNTQVSKTEVSKTEEITTWHWRAGSKKIHKTTIVRERNR